MSSVRPGSRLRGRFRVIALAVVVAFVVMLLFVQEVAGLYVDVLWFDSVGQTSTMATVIRTKIALVCVLGAGLTACVLANLVLADRCAPDLTPMQADISARDAYLVVVGKHHARLRVAVAALVGLLVAWPASDHWQEWMLFRNAVSFGVKDAQFGTDVGFYVFRLPFLTYLVGWAFSAVIAVLAMTALAYALNGGIILHRVHRSISPQVKLHLSVLLGILALVKALDYWLQRYELTTSQRGYVSGAGFTDVRAQLPVLQLLILVSVLAAGLFVVNVHERGLGLPVMTVALWSVVAVVAGAIYPTFVQRFQVEPSESTREAPYLEHNIAATRAAMDLDDVDVRPITLREVSSADIEGSTDTLADVRILDPDVIANTYQVDEGRLSGYEIGDLDVDRYVLDGRLQQVVLAARELDTAGAPIRTWEGRHLAYTHGYGLAFAPASQVDADGRPVYIDVASPENALALTRPEIYFGDGATGYAVVGTNRPGGEESLDPARPSYAGTGGVELSSRLRRVAFWLHFGEYNLYGSRLLSDDSRVLFHRDVREAVSHLAPFLRLDADPYPVVVDGRLVWVVDAYTTSDRYPNAARADTRQLPAESGLRESFNYVRNSVKAVVDAYDGRVTLYVVDDDDPVIAAWQKALPSLFTPGSEVPESLRAHFRYPQDLFHVQTSLFGRYQLLDPQEFYSQQLAWSVSPDAPMEQNAAPVVAAPGSTATTRATGLVADADTARFEPYYTIFRAPAEGARPEFVLLRPFVPFSRNDERRQLQAVMTASSDPATYGQLTAYVMPDPLPDGPSTVASNINQRFSRELTLIDRTGSEVRFGDLQVVPVGGGIVYVRPWFVQAVSNPIPVLDSVSVTSGGRSEVGPSLSAALGKLFSVDVDLGDRPPSSDGAATTPATPDPVGDAPPAATEGQPPDGPTVEGLLAEASRLFDEAQAARQSFDTRAYEEKMEEAYAVLRQATELATGRPVDIVDT